MLTKPEDYATEAIKTRKTSAGFKGFDRTLRTVRGQWVSNTSNATSNCDRNETNQRLNERDRPGILDRAALPATSWEGRYLRRNHLT